MLFRSKRVERFIGVAPRSSDLRSLLSSLCQELRQRNPRADALPNEIKELRDEFSQHLQAATAEQPLILFLDALDQLADANNGRLLNWLPLGSLPAHVKLVVSCLSDRATGDPAGQPYAELQRRPIPAENFINLDVLSEAEARLLLFDRWLPKAGRKVSEDQRARIEQRLASPACRQPIYLKLLSDEVQLWHSYDSASVPGESVPALLKQLFDRLSQPANHGPLLVNRVLGYLSASRHGLAENEILEVLFADPEYRAKLNEATEQARHELPPNAKRIPIALWSRLRFDLASYLSERAAPGANVLTFYHRQIAAWARQRFAEAFDLGWQPHALLADYFDAQDSFSESLTEQQARAKRLPPSPRSTNARKADELPWQRLEAAKRSGEWEALEELLTNVLFLEAKVEAGMVSDLAADFARTLAVLPSVRRKWRILSLLAEALRRDIHFIGWYPTTLFQCLWNSCWWLDHGREDGVSHEDSDDPTFASRLLAAAHLKEAKQPGFLWVRSLRPPENAVGCGQMLALRGRGSPIACSAVPACLACTNTFRAIEIWDLSRAELLYVLPFHVSDTMVYSTAIALSPDGRFLAQATNYSHELRLVNVENGELLWRTTDTLDTRIDFLSFKADGRQLVCAGGDLLAVLEVSSGEILTRSRGERYDRIACLPSLARIACTARTKRRVLLPDGSVERDFPSSEVDLTSIAIAPDGSKVATGNRAGETEVFSLPNAECTRKLGWPDAKAAVTALSFTAAGDGLIVGRDDGVVQITDNAGLLLSDNRFHRCGVEQAVLASTAGLVITGSTDSIAAWSAPMSPHRNKARRVDHREPVNGIAYSEDGTEIASVSACELRLWEAKTGKHVGAWPLLLPAPARRPHDLSDGILVRYNKAKQRIIVATWSETSGDGIALVVIKLPEASTMLRLEAPTSGSKADKDVLVGFDVPDLSDVFITWSRRTLTVWDIDMAQVIREVQHSHDRDNIICGAVSPDGRFVATGGDDGVVRIWSLLTGSCDGAFSRHNKPVYLIRWARSGRSVVSVSGDGLICVWDAAHQCELHRFQHTNIHDEYSALRALAISDDEG